MEWLRENFFWLVVTVLFIWMHLKMHGGHGHGGHEGQTRGKDGSIPGPPGPESNRKEGHRAEH